MPCFMPAPHCFGVEPHAKKTMVEIRGRHHLEFCWLRVGVGQHRRPNAQVVGRVVARRYGRLGGGAPCGRCHLCRHTPHDCGAKQFAFGRLFCFASGVQAPAPTVGARPVGGGAQHRVFLFRALALRGARPDANGHGQTLHLGLGLVGPGHASGTCGWGGVDIHPHAPDSSRQPRCVDTISQLDAAPVAAGGRCAGGFVGQRPTDLALCVHHSSRSRHTAPSGHGEARLWQRPFLARAGAFGRPRNGASPRAPRGPD